MERSICRNCGARVYAQSWHDGERDRITWHHDNYGNVGCRAASFDESYPGMDAWDNRIPREWKAAPLTPRKPTPTLTPR